MRPPRSARSPLLMAALLSLLPSAAGVCPTPAADQEKPEPKVEVKPVTYVQFEDALKDLKGRVVVLDVWAYY